MVVCLDSGSYDYDHFCVTTTLRGVMNFDFKVEIANEGVHSGTGSGIMPDTFRIARNLIEKFEDSQTGRLPSELYVNLPPDKYKQAYDFIE